MFVFCHNTYAEEFEDLMAEQYNFKPKPKESVLVELENKIQNASVTGAHDKDSRRMSSSSSSSSALSSRHGKEDGESSSDESKKVKLQNRARFAKHNHSG